MPKPKQKSFQEQLFQRIKELLPPGKTLADVVADVLNISPDSAYRRIRCETLLVLDEAQELCQYFALSLDTIFQLHNDAIVFHRTEIDADSYNFTSYLKGILHLLRQLDRYSEKKILYLTKGIPIFHLFPFRPLLAFRYYFWMRTSFDIPELQRQKFSMQLLPSEAEAIGMEILSLYNKIPSVEIWSRENINSIQLQIDFCHVAGLITCKEANEVTDSLQQMLEHVQMQAGHGCKFLPVENPLYKKDNFQLFCNCLGLGNDMILATHEGNKTLYVNNDALDYLTCTDKAYCDKVHQKMQSVLRRSTLISSNSEKLRNMFFNNLYAKLPIREVNNENFLF